MAVTPHYWEEAKIYLSGNDRVMGGIISSYGGETLQKKYDPFITLARSITGQQISVKAADSVWNKLEKNLGKITAKNILKCEEDLLRASGYSKQKVSYLKNIAENFANGNISAELLADMDEETAIKELVKLKGVGRWTAEMFLIFHMMKPDVFPIADLGLQKAIKLHYSTEKDGMLKLAEKWRPYCTVATWYLWRSLDPVPVQY